MQLCCARVSLPAGLCTLVSIFKVTDLCKKNTNYLLFTQLINYGQFLLHKSKRTERLDPIALSYTTLSLRPPILGHQTQRAVVFKSSLMPAEFTFLDRCAADPLFVAAHRITTPYRCCCSLLRQTMVSGPHVLCLQMQDYIG